MAQGILRAIRSGVIGAIAIGFAAEWSNAEASSMKIRMKVKDAEVIIALADNASSRDLAALLPLRLTLEDYGAVEKIGYLPRKLSTDGAPAASTPSAGDVSYYAPWGNLAFFRKGFNHSPGLIPLGRVEAGLEALNATGRVEVLMERLDR
jgi:hypothetical protein